MKRELLATLFIMNLLIIATLASCTAMPTSQDQSRIFMEEGTDMVSINPLTGASHRWKFSGYSVGISPDGKQFAYYTKGSSTRYIWVSDTDGTNARKIAEYPYPLNCPMHQSLTWSDDGRQIGFICGKRLFVVAVATGERQFYTVDLIHSFAWRPRHSQQFSAYIEIKPDHPALYLFDPDRQTYQFLAGSVIDAAWSPDGERLAFVKSRGGGPNELVVMDLESFARTTVYSSTRSYLDRLAWSPDGQSIVMIADSFDVVLVGLDGAETRLISEEAKPGAHGRPLWSPDGQSVAYLKRNRETGSPSLVVVDVASGSERVLATELSSGVELLAWR